MKKILLYILMGMTTQIEGSVESAFTKIYEEGQWGKDQNGRSTPGSGSQPSEAWPYMEFLQNFIDANEIHSVVDLGCGDWPFSKMIDWKNRQYTGIDPVKSVIERNQARFASEQISFIHANALTMELPTADLLICKDVLQHLSYQQIEQFLAKARQFPHCLITNDYDPNFINRDIKTGGYRPLDLTRFPFFLDGVKIFTYQSGDVTKQVLYLKNRSLETKTVTLAILARNKASSLPHYLKYIENLDYDKKLIGLYVNTNNNVDDTQKLLKEWLRLNEDKYGVVA